MKIFSPQERSIANEKGQRSEGPKKSGKNKMKRLVPEKSKLSEQEIREKMAAHVETSSAAKSMAVKKNTQALGAGFMNAEVSAAKAVAAKAVAAEAPGEPMEKGSGAKEAHLLLSDVQLNDPNDSNTQEKLKSVLRNGAFSFNPKEKETLEKILAG